MPKFSAVQSAAASVNVSFREILSPDDLVGIFRGQVDPAPWIPHLDIFFNELPRPLLTRFMAENSLTLERLSAVYDSLHPAWQGKNFKELRDGALAGPFS
ncbi:MAG: hypothetical protein LBV21_06720 [Candidatus Adiutrix sp.]|jgi:hypothetical protein|nr:hypothetical protein [Candidatus Adiutrix sp.]